MSEKKKQEYTTGGLKNRKDVENALASAEYRPSQEVTDAASDLKQWQANRPGDYESAYQGRIDGLMEDLLDRKEFSYSYGADPLYRQYAQLYTQNAANASADAAAQAAALTGGCGSSCAASVAQQAYQQQIGALSEAIPTLYRLALDTYTGGGEELVTKLDQLGAREQNDQNLYNHELADLLHPIAAERRRLQRGLCAGLRAVSGLPEPAGHPVWLLCGCRSSRPPAGSRKNSTAP